MRASAKEAFANGTVRATTTASTGAVDAHTATIGDAATTTDYTTVCQANPTATCDTATAIIADGAPPCDRGATLNTGGGAGTRNVIEVSNQTGAIAATKNVTDDARKGAGSEEHGIRADYRVAAAATTDGVTDARREQAAPR